MSLIFFYFRNLWFEKFNQLNHLFYKLDRRMKSMCFCMYRA